MKKQKRYYVPTISELIDRLSICTLKKIWIPENADEYQKEIDLIKLDINSIMEKTDEIQAFNANMIEASMIIMLSNRVIWENESKARQGGNEQDKLLKFTHSINGVRNTAKNIISNGFGERTDLKIDCLAADVPKEFGNWRNVFKIVEEDPFDGEVMNEDYIDIDRNIDDVDVELLDIDDILNDISNTEIVTNSMPITTYETNKNVKYKI